MKNIPLNAAVECVDGQVGQSTHVIVNPVNGQVTFVVVKATAADDAERLVPIDHVSETGPAEIKLNCSSEQFAQMTPFVETHYIKNEAQDFDNADFVLPYAVPRETDIIQVDDMNIPGGQLAVNRGTGVEAADGWVGRVEEFLVSPHSGSITHLVVRQAHWSGKRELTLPVSTVERVFDNVVYLKLDKKGVATLPTIPATRSWGFPGASIELVALVFDGSDKAGEVVKFIKKMRQEHTIARIRNFAVLVKDADGKVSLNEDKDVDKRQGAIFGAISGGLIGLLAGPVGAIVGAAAGAATGRVAADKIDMGFSNDYLQGLQEHLKPNSSAVLAVVEHQWVGSVTDALKDFGGAVFTQALPDEIAAQLLSESDSAG